MKVYLCILQNFDPFFDIYILVSFYIQKKLSNLLIDILVKKRLVIKKYFLTELSKL